MHQDEQDKVDLKELIEVYQTAKRFGKVAVYVLGVALAVASLMLAIKQIKAP